MLTDLGTPGGTKAPARQEENHGGSRVRPTGRSADARATDRRLETGGQGRRTTRRPRARRDRSPAHPPRTTGEVRHRTGPPHRAGGRPRRGRGLLDRRRVARTARPGVLPPLPPARHHDPEGSFAWISSSPDRVRAGPADPPQPPPRRAAPP